MNFAPNCTTRGPQSELTKPLLALPNAAEPQLPPKGVLPLHPVLTYWYWTWLKVLNDSTRNCSWECSPLNHGKLKFLSIAKSVLLRPGPVRTLRPIQPNMQVSPLARNWLAVGCAVVLGLYHCSVGP